MAVKYVRCISCEAGMRGANAYRPLNEAHERMDAEPVLPGTRYEAVRDTQHRLDERMTQEGPRPGPNGAKDTVESRLDAIEARLASLDKELSAMREDRAPEAAPQQAAPKGEPDIDRLLALHDRPTAEPSAPEPSNQRDYVAPERWTERGGMVEQQASAMDWHKHILDERQKRAAEQVQPSDQMSPEALSVLNAARTHEAQGQQQETERAQARDYPAP